MLLCLGATLKILGRVLPKTIAILHFASPPVVGGVESTIAHHARLLTDQGYAVRVVTGEGASFDPRIPVIVEPIFNSRHPDVEAAKRDLDKGIVSPAFELLMARQRAALETALAGVDVCIAHNVHTLHKNLSLTAALAKLPSAQPRMIAWCHDLAWTNAQYQRELHSGYPWNLLSHPWPNTRYVTVSVPRQAELAALFNVSPATIRVITPGVDPAAFFRWHPTTRDLASRLHLLDADLLLLLPARLTRRKNIGLALHVLAALREMTGRDARLIVTGPPGPHNASNAAYLNELQALKTELGLETAAHFLYEDAPVLEDDVIADLYQLADALFFPSTQEGFGIPLLEAGLAGLPVFCADIPPLRQTGQDDVVYLNLQADEPSAIARQLYDDLVRRDTYRLRARVRREYRWDVIVQDQIMPLLEAE